MIETRLLYRLLSQSRIKLNLIYMIAKFLSFFTWTGAVSGGVFILVRCTQWLSVKTEFWFLISSVGGLIGVIISWRHRLDEYATASWLDEHFKNNELLSSALVCLKRGCSGSFDQRILDAANEFSNKSNQVKWPLKYLFKQTGKAVALVLFFTVVFFYLTPFLHGRNFTNIDSVAHKESIANQSRQNSRQLDVESPRALAKMLFPQDERMAMLAERAFREGNLAVLQNLLRDAELNMERLMAESISLEQRNRLKSEVEQRRQLMETLLAQSQQKNQMVSRDQKVENPDLSQLADQDMDDNNKTGEKNPLAQRNNNKNDQLSQTKRKTTSPNPYESLPYGGNKAGDGHNPNKGKWGKITSRTGKEETIISKNKDSQVLEYLLPGKNARLPLSQVVPDAERSAEAAIHRQGIPFEYEDFVRNYFLLLAQESKEAAIKEAQK